MTSAGRRGMTVACGMRNGAGMRRPGSSGVIAEVWGGWAVRLAGTRSMRSHGICGSRRARCGRGAGLAGRRGGGAQVKRPVSRTRLSPRRGPRLEAELAPGAAGARRAAWSCQMRANVAHYSDVRPGKEVPSKFC